MALCDMMSVSTSILIISFACDANIRAKRALRMSGNPASEWLLLRTIQLAEIMNYGVELLCFP